MLLYGDKCKADMWERVQRAWKRIQQYKYMLPDSLAYQLARFRRRLHGIRTMLEPLGQLIHFADFAMYKVKRSAQGTLEVFNFEEDYHQESFLISGRDALDRMIDQRAGALRGMAIIHAKTGGLWL